MCIELSDGRECGAFCSRFRVRAAGINRSFETYIWHRGLCADVRDRMEDGEWGNTGFLNPLSLTAIRI